MSLTFSNMFPLGEEAPNFELQDVKTGQKVSLNETKSNIATVIMFICNHCPYVKHINTEISKVAQDYMSRGIKFIAISSNDAESFPNDSPEKLKEQADHYGFIFPYLYDKNQTVAKAYKAACTPDFYIFDHDLKCVYRGQLDQSRPNNNIPVTGKDIRDALNAILNNKSVKVDQQPSSGCNIKWKKGVYPF